MNTDYLPAPHELHNGNGNQNGNGHVQKTPSEKAWQTARDQAASEARTPFLQQLDEEIRALTDPALPDGAARLFCLIVKFSWQSFHGGKYHGRIGSLAISSRKLAKKLGCNVKAFYAKKDKRTGARRPGWIELLVQGGYVWIGHHKIPNIPENKSLNVYNVCCLVPRFHQAHLPWSDGNWGGEVVIEEQESDTGMDAGEAVPRNGNRVFLSPEQAGNGESPEKGTPSPPQRAHAVPRNGNSPSPATGIASPPQGARAVPRNGNRLSPATVTGRPPQGAQAVPRNGHRPSPATGLIVETGEVKTSIETSKGAVAPPVKSSWDTEFEKWRGGLDHKFDRELRESLGDLKAEREKLKEFGPATPATAEQLRRLKLKIEAVNVRLNGPK